MGRRIDAQLRIREARTTKRSLAAFGPSKTSGASAQSKQTGHEYDQRPVSRCQQAWLWRQSAGLNGCLHSSNILQQTTYRRVASARSWLALRRADTFLRPHPPYLASLRSPSVPFSLKRPAGFASLPRGALPFRGALTRLRLSQSSNAHKRANKYIYIYLVEGKKARSGQAHGRGRQLSSAGPLWRPCALKRTQLTTTGLAFSVCLEPDGTTTVRLIA